MKLPNFSSRFRRSAAFVLTLVVGASVVTLSTAGPAQASCSTLTDQSIAGNLTGDDGQAVNAVIGFTFVDEFGYRLDIRGCRLQGDAYGRVFHLNSNLPATGAAQTSTTSNYFWIDRIPANVKEVWVETYPKGPNGVTDYSHYTGVYQPKVAPGTMNLNLHLPVTCAAGGRTGAIVGTVFIGGKAVDPTWMGFWSQGSTNGKMGYALSGGTQGGFTSPPLATNPINDQPQHYQVVVDWNGIMLHRYEVPVFPCQTTHVRIDG